LIREVVRFKTKFFEFLLVFLPQDQILVFTAPKNAILAFS